MNKILVASFFAFCMLAALSACSLTNYTGGTDLLVPMIQWAF